MKKLVICMFAVLAGATLLLTFAACGGGSGSGKAGAKADSLITQAYRMKNYQLLMALADSFQRSGELPMPVADYWLGYANDRLHQPRVAEFYWKSVLSELEGSTKPADLAIYAKAASRLTNVLSVRGDYQEALRVAVPVVERLEKLGCDTTSDYTNLLIFVGCCQSRYGMSDETVNDNYNRAYSMHKANIEKRRTDEAYKNAIAGLINIAYNCNGTEHYNDALKWTDKYGQLISEYEMRNDARPDYVDKQWARYALYRAIALEGLGRTEDATEAYGNYQKTQFAQTPEGHIDATDFLNAARRWDEAADAYRSLDEALSAQNATPALETMQNMALRKYRANLLAGRKDSASAVAHRICELLDEAITQSRQQDRKEQETVRLKEEQKAELQASDVRQHTKTILGIIGVIFVLLAAYTVYRRKLSYRLAKAHEKLKTAYGVLEQNTIVKERSESEQRIGHAIQMAMLPTSFPHRSDFDIYASLTPAKLVGGTFYDFRVRDEKLYFCIGDASGLGVSASVAMAVTRALFHSVSAYEENPAQIVAAINKTVAESNQSSMSVTLFVGALDLSNGRLHYCNAGHHAPLLVGSGIGELPDAQSLPIGQMVDGNFVLQETLIDPGTVIFLYTDGLIKAENQQHDTFGKQRMMSEALQSLHGLDPAPQQFVQRMMASVKRFIGEVELADDVTMVAVRYTKLNTELSMQRSISLPNDKEQMPYLERFVEDICQKLRFKAAATTQLSELIESAVASAMEAYAEDVHGEVHIEATANATELRFVVRDAGRRHDATAKLDNELQLRLKVQSNYEYVAAENENKEQTGSGQNVLTIVKSLK